MERLTDKEIILGFHLSSSLVVFYAISLIKDPTQKQYASSIHGIFILVTVCGWGFVHLLVGLLGSSFIILKTNRRYCHVTCFLFTFTHLSIFHLRDELGLPEVPVYTHSSMTILVLKIIHLAGEVQDAHNNNYTKKYGEDIYKNLSLLKICHFNFCGIATVNFFNYRTYNDWICYSLYTHANRKQEIHQELQRVAWLSFLFIPAGVLFPGEYLKKQQFYEEPLLYRLVYSALVGISVRVAMYAILCWTYILAVMAGIGAYPSVTIPKPGKGPTARFDLLQETIQNSDCGRQEEYNFEAVRHMDVWKAEFSPTVRDFWRYYNSTITYFFAANVYKRFPVKSLKTSAVFFISAWWHGFHGGFFLSLCYTAIYIPVENLWNTIKRNKAKGFQRKLWDLVFFTCKFSAVTYISLTSYLQSYEDALRYTASLYYLPYIAPAVFYCLGLVLSKEKSKVRR